jgi:Carboxypeptidase regulatory-like domain/TonB dependent receptor-like, beta-barrel
VLALTLALCGFSVQGTLHAGRSGEPVAYAVVQTVDRMAQVESDSTGRYHLACLSPTTHAIRFSRMGFQSRTVDITAADGDTVRLDIELSPVPVMLPSATVAGKPDREPSPGPGRIGTAWTFASEDLAQSPLVGDPDPLLGLPVPDLLTGGDPIPGLHVRGGSADQNLTLLDGVPVFSPYHAGGSSAIGLDALSRITLEGGVAPARWDGGLSSVVVAETRIAPDRGVAWDGSSDALWTGQFVSSRILRGTGDVLLGGRMRNQLFGSPDHGQGMNAADGLGRATLPVFGGDLELLVFGSQDHFGFEAIAGPDDGAEQEPGEPGNAFAWTTQTEALMWQRTLAPRTNVDFRLWRTAYDGTAHWFATAPLLVESGLRNLGATALVSGTPLATRGTVGVEVNRFATSYLVRDAGLEDTPAPLLDESAAPLVVVGFMEDSWQAPNGRWSMTAGLRGEFSRRVELEPRVTVRFAPTSSVALTAGYSQSRQYVQSLSNPESILGTVMGIALPVAADGARFPVGRANQSSASLTLRPAPATTLNLAVYLRRMDDLLLVAPVTSQPFATDSVAIGSGRASGALVAFAHRTGRVTIQGIYAYGTTTRTASGTTYSPGAEAAHAFAAGITALLSRGVRIRADVAASLGRRSTLLGDSLKWSPASQLGGVGDIDGSPQEIRGALGGQALPGYARFDLGVRREWATTVRGHVARLLASVTVYNVLGRTNVAALVQPATEPTAQALPLAPRGISFRLEWHHE